MSYIDAIILGLVQGLTEFLPVSSSGHLILAEHILDLKLPGILFELMVHFGTLMSVLVFFRKKILALFKSIFRPDMIDERKMILYLIIGTIPIIVIVLLFHDFFKRAFLSPLMVSVMLIVTGLFLSSTVFIKQGSRKLGFLSVVVIGISQALAIMPGISRSGATITTGLHLGIKPMVAAEFSFMLAIPGIFGAIIYKMGEILSLNSACWSQYLVGTIVSFLSGLFAVYILLEIIKKGKFIYFGAYCLLIGIIGVIYLI